MLFSKYLSMKFLINNEIPLDKWNRMIRNCPFSTVFQTHSYYEFFNSVPGLSSEVFAVEVDNILVALCVVTLQKEKGAKGFFSRRAIIYGGPLILSKDDKILSFLLSSIIEEIKSKIIYIEIRNFNDYSSFSEIYRKNKWLYLPYQNYIINVLDNDDVFKKLGDNRKRQVRKSVRSGTQIKTANDLKEVNEFYTILKELYNNKIHRPLPEWQFFKEFYERKIGIFLLVVYKGAIIGGIMCPVFMNKCIYELFICGMDDKFREQYPSVMATWAAIDYTAQNKFMFFDFMGAGMKGKDYGVRDFKARFGGDFVEYGRYRFINNRFLFKLGKMALAVSKKISIISN